MNTQPNEAENIIALPPATTIPQEKDNEQEGVFWFEGRRYQLYKRTHGRRGSFYIRFMYEGQKFKKSLETNVWKMAVKRAKVEIAAVRGGKWSEVEALKARRTVSTVGDLKPLFLPEGTPGISAATCSQHSATNAWWALGKVLRESLGIHAPSDNGARKDVPRHSLAEANERLAGISLAEINEGLAERFQDAMVRRYLAGETEPDRQRMARDKALRSSRSIIQQARQVFTSRGQDLRPIYERHGLKIPDCIEGFIRCRLKGSLAKADYYPPSDQIVQKAFDRIPELLTSDPQSYTAFWLAVGAGLRRGEILRARWEHFVTRENVFWFSGTVGKNGKLIEVPMQIKAWEKLQAVKKETGLCLGEDATIEYARRLNGWMTQIGWQTEKKLHELRAYIGSLMYNHDPEAARQFMRHSKLETTVRQYKRYAMLVKVPQVL